MDTDGSKILHKELSYKIQGLIFAVRNDLGSGHKESIYQKALERELVNDNIRFKREPAIKIYSRKGEYLGLYRPDFSIEDKMLIELKATPQVSRQEMVRIYDYLRNSKYELAYLINFASPKLYIRRFIFTNNRKHWLKNLAVLFVAIGFLFVGIRGVSGAEFSFDKKTQELSIGQQFQVDLTVNTERDSINAFEGKISFPQDLELKGIRDGNSIVTFWIEKPKEISRGQVVFSGIIPGGYQDESGFLFSLIFRGAKQGSGLVEIYDVKALKNDGEGTAAETRTFPLRFSVSQEIHEIPIIEIKDFVPPESFKPEVGRDPAIYDGKWFLVFATQDKESGIDHYEVREGKRPFATAESPYLLENQNLDEKISVKAVDKSGNERIITLSAPKLLPWYENYLIWCIIIMLAYLVYKILWRAKIIRQWRRK